MLKVKLIHDSLATAWRLIAMVKVYLTSGQKTDKNHKNVIILTLGVNFFIRSVPNPEFHNVGVTKV